MNIKMTIRNILTLIIRNDAKIMWIFPIKNNRIVCILHFGINIHVTQSILQEVNNEVKNIRN